MGHVFPEVASEREESSLKHQQPAILVTDLMEHGKDEKMTKFTKSEKYFNFGKRNEEGRNGQILGTNARTDKSMIHQDVLGLQDPVVIPPFLGTIHLSV